MKQNTVYYHHHCQRQKELEQKSEVPLSCSASNKVKNLGRNEFHDDGPFTKEAILVKSIVERILPSMDVLITI
jgi:hypothetical protein